MSKYKIDNLSKPEILPETASNKVAKLFIITLSFIVLLFVLWACFAKIDEVAVAMGSVIPKMRTQKIQHISGGVVEGIYVSNGMFVKKGQVLIKLESIKSSSLLDETDMQIQSLTGRKQRIKALLNNTEPDFSSIKDMEIKNIEEELYNSIKMTNTLEMDLINAQIDQLHSNVIQLKIQKETLVNQMRYLNEELDINKRLLEKGAVPKVRILKINRDKSDLNQELLPFDEEIIKAVKKISELKIKLSQVTMNMKKELRIELEGVNHDLIQLIEKKDRYVDENKKTYIKTPISGFVHNLAKFTIGGTVERNEVMMQIIPENPELLVRVDISPIDIGHIEVGQKANIKLTAYDFSRYGDIDGIVEKISPAATSAIEIPSLQNQRQQAVPTYEAIIKPLKTKMTIKGKVKSLKPGMAVMVDIKTGEKRLMQYLLKPIFISLNQALRER
jgi:membrane fusion protein, adhesin transport system